MRAVTLLPMLIAAFLAHQSQASPEHLGSLQEHRATVYSGECDGQTDHMADGTHINESAGGTLSRHGKPVNSHAIASTFLPLGTKVRFTRPVYGSRVWTVRDSGGEFDLYVPACHYGSWSNPTLYYRVLLR